MSNKVLVLGATGNVGGILVENLKKQNAQFISAVHSDAGKEKLKRMNLETISLDFNDPESLDKAMQGIDSLFMLTPAEEQIETWTRNILESARKNGIGFILRSSYMDASPDSPHLLYKLHGEADRMLRESGIPYSIILPNNFMQNFAVYWAPVINNKNQFFFMHGDVRVSYIDLRDVAAIAADILSHPAIHKGGEYTITGPDSLSNQDVARYLSESAGRIIRYLPLDENQYMKELRAMGLSEWNVGINISIERNIMDGNQTITSTEMQAITGKLSTSFVQFVMDYAAVWKKSRIPVR